MTKAIILQIWRAAGVTLTAAYINALTNSMAGLYVIPVLMGISKGLKKYFEIKNKSKPAHQRYPWWLVFLPF